jgi:hypothetical protein
MPRRLLGPLVAGAALLAVTASAVVALAAGAAAAPPVISNLSVKDTAHAARWSIQANLQRGNRIYADRTSTFTAVPPVLAGADWVRDVNASRTFTGSPLATFALSAGADVYVGLDGRTRRPAWVDGTWASTGLTETSSAHVTYHLFRKTFPSGPVSLGSIGSHHGRQAMYTIAAVATAVPTPTPTLSPTPTPTVSPGGGTTYEAEAPGNTLSGTAARRACAFCSGGAEVGHILGHGSADALQFNGVMAPADGVYAVTWHYVAGDPNGDTRCGGEPNPPPQGCRPGDIVINGVTPGTIYQFPDTPNWHTLGTLTLQLHLRAGANTIRISSATQDVADIDRIVVVT